MEGHTTLKANDQMTGTTEHDGLMTTIKIICYMAEMSAVGAKATFSDMYHTLKGPICILSTLQVCLYIYR